MGAAEEGELRLPNAGRPNLMTSPSSRAVGPSKWKSQSPSRLRETRAPDSVLSGQAEALDVWFSRVVASQTIPEDRPGTPASQGGCRYIRIADMNGVLSRNRLD